MDKPEAPNNLRLKCSKERLRELVGEDVRASNVVPMRRRNGVAKRPTRVTTTAERRRRTARKR